MIIIGASQKNHQAPKASTMATLQVVAVAVAAVVLLSTSTSSQYHNKLTYFHPDFALSCLFWPPRFNGKTAISRTRMQWTNWNLAQTLDSQTHATIATRDPLSRARRAKSDEIAAPTSAYRHRRSLLSATATKGIFEFRRSLQRQP